MIDAYLWLILQFPNTTETYPTPTYTFDYDSSLDEGPNPLWSEWRPRRH